MGGSKVSADEKAFQRLLGSVIRQLRELQSPRMSAATLSERIGRSEAAVSRWETGKATPTAWDLRQIADAFDLTDDQLDVLIRPPKARSVRSRCGSQRPWQKDPVGV